MSKLPPKNPLISIVLPCRNEEHALKYCLDSLMTIIEKRQLNAEIIVSDSSTDQSPQIARNYNVRLIKHDKKGYGLACQEGFKAARGEYIFLADPDGSYDFKEIPRFIDLLEHDYDFVIGNRFKGIIKRDAMPWHHQYLGNPILSFVLRKTFRANIYDAHCGMRAIRKEALDKLDLETTGMEFASEMVIKTTLQNFRIKEIPINYYKRLGHSKLRSFIDGYRHLKLILFYNFSS